MNPSKKIKNPSKRGVLPGTDRAETITMIRPSKGWKMVNWKELFSYKDLLYFFTIRSIKARYAQSVLGIGWAIIQPLVTTLVFTVVFGNLAKISSDGVPYIIFSYAALVPWNYFSNTLTDSSNSLVQNSGMITKVYFPRLVLPLSAAFSKLLDFLISFAILVGFMIYFRFVPSLNIVTLPLLILILLLTSLGIGMILSSMAVQFRDVKYAISFVVSLLMYAAPVVYPSSIVPDKWRFLYSLNPMVGVIEGFRSALLGTQPMPWDFILSGGIIALIIFLFGAFYFRRMERIFADVV